MSTSFSSHVSKYNPLGQRPLDTICKHLNILSEKPRNFDLDDKHINWFCKFKNKKYILEEIDLLKVIDRTHSWTNEGVPVWFLTTNVY